ncbi:MAG: hypothetical protein ACRDTG_07760 [Pseudonocardiaceae bacterium]
MLTKTAVFALPVLAAGGDQNGVVASRDALTSVDELLGELDDADAPDVTEFSRTVTYVFGLHWAGPYGRTVLIPARWTLAAAEATLCGWVGVTGAAGL